MRASFIPQPRRFVMRRAVAIIVAFAAVAFVTVAAQAESKGEQVFKADMDALLRYLKTLK
jgi:hypothetical protein